MKKEKILVVDDDQTTLTMLGEYLSKNYEVTVVSSFKKALEIYYKKDFNLFLLDISLDDGDGIELAKIIKNNEKFDFSPIIIISQHEETEYMEEVFKVGVDDYIIKPINLKELYIRIKRRLYVSEYQKKIFDDYNHLYKQLLDLSEELKKEKTLKIQEEDYAHNEIKFKKNSERINENIKNSQVFDERLNDMKAKLIEQKKLIERVKNYLN